MTNQIVFLLGEVAIDAKVTNAGVVLLENIRVAA